MSGDDIRKCADCVHNYLWVCKHPSQRNNKCVGRCEKYSNGISCTECGNPIEQGYCVNKLCNSHGR